MPQPTINPALGWATDLVAEALPPGFLTNVRDAFNRDGSIGRSDAFAKLYAPALGAPRYLIPNQAEGSGAFWVYATDDAVGVVDGSGVHKAITPTTYGTHSVTNRQLFSGGLVNGFPVLNSATNGAWWWDQDYGVPSLMQPLPDFASVGDQVEVMRPFQQYLIGMNITRGITQFPDLLAWSDAAAPGAVPQSWTPGVASQAGEISVSFNDGPLVDGAQLVDRFYAYKPHSVYVLTLVGGAFVFQQRPVFATFGALAKGCIVEWRGRHIVLTDGDLIAHDGTNVESLAKDRTRREIFDNLDPENFRNAYLVLDKENRRLHVCRPRRGEVWPSEAITFDLDDGSYGHQTLPTVSPHGVEGVADRDAGVGVETRWSDRTTTWTTDPTRWSDGEYSRIQEKLVFGDRATSQLLVFGEGVDHNGQPIDTLLERTNIQLGNPNRRKFIRRVYPRFYGADGNRISISIGVQETPTSAVRWGPEREFVIGRDRYVTIDRAGYLVSYRMRAVGTGVWRMPAFELNFEWLGEF